jgi:hypothetical protein
MAIKAKWGFYFWRIEIQQRYVRNAAFLSWWFVPDNVFATGSPLSPFKCIFFVWFINHRIHGAAIYGVPWIPSIYPSHVSINIPAPWIFYGLSNFRLNHDFPWCFTRVFLAFSPHFPLVNPPSSHHLGGKAKAPLRISPATWWAMAPVAAGGPSAGAVFNGFHSELGRMRLWMILWL